ncbi:YsnF/AvaK domain-containing protein [Actinorugispora endophytica]|uniref:Uncharacterized protein (TIGR02271 family) n=1 Tax=Actinorugispora endophytica TaxID=1605990 RepID=A0A4R6UKK5_9ACTN|nr:YsnF/AvaK domain-containing protein [Actinorugispora endophytica]TDQ45635.1 uncharacterized protein (TIGR02271 family) [Actinorugispora endophytica]
MAPRLGVQDLVGHRLLDKDGHNVGKIGQVYRDDQTHQPTWVTVHTGMFGTQESFVPLAGAQISHEDLRVPFDKGMIKDSPRFEAGRHLSPDEESRLYRHYGVQPSVPGPRGEAETRPGETMTEERRTAEGRDMGRDMGRRSGEGVPPTGTGEAGGRPMARGETAYGETSVTRSEEQAHVGVERQESGRARVRKTVETEHFEQDVPVKREEIRVHREPITERDRAAGTVIGEEDEEIILSEEHAVLGKEQVPVEKVRITKEEVTDTEHVEGELRKENIEIDEEGRPRRHRRP